MINFNTDKLILLHYPRGAGGKFLANCIGLSNSAFFQSADLVEQQLKNNFSYDDKKNYLLTQLAEAKENWNDLNLGCGKLFGVYYHSLKKDIVVNNEIRNLFNFNKIIETISNGENYFFKVAHSIHDLEIEMKFWPNAKIVYFYNYTDFIKKYRPDYLNILDRGLDFEKHYQMVRGTDWPESFPDKTTYLSLTSDIKKEIDYYFEGVSDVNLLAELSPRILYKWNVDDYFSFDQTYYSLSEIYKTLGISDVDKQTLKSYYDSWIAELEKLKFSPANSRDKK